MFSDLFNGPVAIGIRQTLPFKGAHLLVGNNLAGNKVVVNSLVTDTPCMDLSDLDSTYFIAFKQRDRTQVITTLDSLLPKHILKTS